MYVTPLCCNNWRRAALRRPDGTFVFNGNWAISWSGDYEAAGTTFTYRRQDAATPELISAQGPLAEPIDIMVRRLIACNRCEGEKKSIAPQKARDIHHVFMALIPSF